MNLVGLTVDSVSGSSINAQNSNIAQTVLGAVNLGSDLAYSMDVNVKVLTSDLLSATSYANSGTVNLNAGTLASIISGTGTTNILEDVINNDKTITQNSVVVTGGLTTKADAVISANGIDNSGSVTLYDGTLVSLIKGEGTTNIAGNVTNNV